MKDSVYPDPFLNPVNINLKDKREGKLYNFTDWFIS